MKGIYRMSNVIHDIINLSSGTMSTLTGKNKYVENDAIQLEFLIFVQNSKETFENWQEAWHSFIKRND
jgi:hypothetical protein